MSKAHAYLSPSAAYRWLACTPSVKLESSFEKRVSSYADEGTLAHDLGELFIKEAVGTILTKEYKKELKLLQESEYYNQTMDDYCSDYADFVVEQYAQAKTHTSDAQLYLEKSLDLTKYAKESFGTGDVGIVADTELIVIDFKYGKGVFVDAYENAQMMMYALGWLDEFEHLYGIKTVKMIIFQPRMDSISVYTLSVKELKTWAKNHLIPRAKLAFKGKGDYVAGDHCKFCRAKVTCRAFADYNLELVKLDFQKPDCLSPEEIVLVLQQADTFKNWVESIEKYALIEAIAGKTWPDMKLVAGRSNRILTDQDNVVKVLSGKGLKEDQIFNKKLKGIGDLEKILGKKDFNSLLFSFIFKPPGAPTLVPTTDPRPIYTNDSALEDFKE